MCDVGSCVRPASRTIASLFNPGVFVNTVRRSGLWVVLLGALLAAPGAAEAATCTWTGLAADNNFSSAGNWDGCGGAHPTPQAGDILVFPAGTARPTPVNDL